MDGNIAIEATREIMWNIPASFKYVMYLMFFASMFIMCKGLYVKLLFVTGGEGFKGIKKLLPEKLNWSNFFKTALLTGKVPRFKNVAIFHGLIFWGFVILWIATDVVAIHFDTPFKIYKGPLYIIVSFTADIAGLMVLTGLALAYKRRYIDKPEYLSATKPKQELFMYAMLASLVIIGYLIEGVRIMGTGMPVGEATWSPVGWFLASIFSKIGLSDTAWAYTYRTMWMYHMINTMVFVASIGYTKFSHIFVLPLAALLTPARRGAVLNPMDFTDETAETFGLGKLSELTMKNKLDLLACVECGRCTQVCPANNAERPLDPKKIITKARDLALETHAAGETDADFWESKHTHLSS
ncbi:(Fe-S)-binding protein [Bacteriovorax sp. DB6_IX]|uniref:(Fe-S)-binding protein n=1 Tax=Bacteriovorax sp. DB6_IX TaxID=1353530 RepID=UPI00038A4E98|nr:(Fe-S)-binding protein [Bacteriovorax sp. DB6_IX]EQC51723.1 nitrate reductase, gamma subunit domain protein [Bacteriovorax sp. DB6_IX]